MTKKVTLQDIVVGGLYTMDTDFMISVENTGWAWYKQKESMFVVLECNALLAEKPKNTLANLLVLMHDGITGILWTTRHIRQLNTSEYPAD